MSARVILLKSLMGASPVDPRSLEIPVLLSSFFIV